MTGGGVAAAHTESRAFRPAQSSVVSPAVSVLLAALLLLRLQPDEVVDAQDGDGRLGGKLQDFELGDRRLQHPRLDVVADAAGQQVQPALQAAARRGARGGEGWQGRVSSGSCSVLPRVLPSPPSPSHPTTQSLPPSPTPPIPT